MHSRHAWIPGLDVPHATSSRLRADESFLHNQSRPGRAECCGTGLGSRGIPETSGEGRVCVYIGKSSAQLSRKKREDKERNTGTPPIHLLHTGSDLSIQIWAGMQHRGMLAGREWLKLGALNQNPPPAALKLSSSNTRGFPVKRKGCLSDRTAGTAEERSCRIFTGLMQYEWFRLNTQSDTEARTRTPHTSC